MRAYRLAAAFLVALAAGSAQAAVTARAPAAAQSALERLKAAWTPQADWFANPQTGAMGQLSVTASDHFLRARVGEKTEAMQRLAAAWGDALAAAGQERPAPLLMEVRWDYGGWLWRADRDGKSGREKLKLVDRWDDGGFPWIYEQATRDKWFVFLGGQSVSGGGAGSSSGLNLRFGTTLFHNRYDLAFLMNRTSTAGSPKIKANAYGAVGRMLFHGKNSLGYNLGAQVLTITGPDIRTDNQVSALGGLNYYLPRGSWDLTLALGDQGSRTLVIGYSLFLNR